MILPETPTIDYSTQLPVMEAFYTIQGEGAYSGHAAYFIRLAGCDVGCVWCDVKESWDLEAHPLLALDEVVAEAARHPARLAVVTGGEPLMHDCGPLTSRLRQLGFKTNIETSGAHPMSGDWDWVCLSPKKFKEPLPEHFAHADELKVIIYNKSDFKWAEGHAAKVRSDCRLLMQPEWSKAAEMLPMMVDYVKNNPNWQVSLQTHKFMDIP